MADTFSISIVTADGANLIAQATSSNQIVMVDALSCTLAATDAADLAGKTAAWYDGVSGTIESSSATDNVAKVVAKFGNAGANSQAVKSIALRAKLASQADSAAVIIAAMSDENSEIVLPSSSSVAQVERVIFNFAVNADEQTETVYADGATIADLDRFVSMYKAGDPTQGEYQIILGDKSFSDDVNISGGLGVVGEVVISNDVEINGGLALDGELSVDSDATFTDSVLISSGDLTVRSEPGNTATILVSERSANTASVQIKNTGITMIDGYNQTGVEIYAGGNATFEGNVTIKGDISAAWGSTKTAQFNWVAAESVDTKELTGIEPTWESNALKVPLGAIVCAYGGSLTSVSQSINVSDVIEIPASTVYTAVWDCSAGAWGNGYVYLPAGIYVALSAYDATGGSTHGPVFLIRTE